MRITQTLVCAPHVAYDDGNVLKPAIIAAQRIHPRAAFAPPVRPTPMRPPDLGNAEVIYTSSYSCLVSESPRTFLNLQRGQSLFERTHRIRSSRWSPTRSALATIVSPGFTAPLEGKKLPSTTYRLSRS